MLHKPTHKNMIIKIDSCILRNKTSVFESAKMQADHYV